MSPLPLHLSTSYVYYILFFPLFQASSSFLSPSITSYISSFPSSTSLISSPLSLYPEQNSSTFQITFSFIPTPPPPLFHLPPSIPFPLVVLSFLNYLFTAPPLPSTITFFLPASVSPFSSSYSLQHLSFPSSNSLLSCSSASPSLNPPFLSLPVLHSIFSSV